MIFSLWCHEVSPNPFGVTCNRVSKISPVQHINRNKHPKVKERFQINFSSLPRKCALHPFLYMTSVITGDLPTHRSRVHEASVKASLAKLSLDQAIVMYQRRECTVLLTCGLCFSLRYFRTDRKSAIVTGKILLSHQHGSCF